MLLTRNIQVIQFNNKIEFVKQFSNHRNNNRIKCQQESPIEQNSKLEDKKISKDEETLKEVEKMAKKMATTFAPRASGKAINVAYKGSILYDIFGWQAWLSMGLGALLSFNIVYPSDSPNIARLLGMWSIWMFTIPSLRARECNQSEKDVLNILFLLIPLVNVILPFIWKSFAFVYSCDVIAMAAIYFWKMGFPLTTTTTTPTDDNMTNFDN